MAHGLGNQYSKASSEKLGKKITAMAVETQKIRKDLLVKMKSFKTDFEQEIKEAAENDEKTDVIYMRYLGKIWKILEIGDKAGVI